MHREINHTILIKKKMGCLLGNRSPDEAKAK